MQEALRELDTDPNISIQIHEAAQCSDVNWFPIDWPGVEDEYDWDMFVYHSRQFLQVWSETIAPARRKKLYLAIARDRVLDKPVLCIPFEITSKKGLKILGIVDDAMPPCQAPAVRSGYRFDKQLFLAIWRDMLAALPPVDLVQLPEIPHHILGAPNPLLHLETELTPAIGPYLKITQDWDSFSTGRAATKKHVKDALRRLRRLGELGEVEIFTSPQPELFGEIADFVLEHRRERVISKFGRDIFARPGILKLFMALTDAANVGVISSLACVRLNGQIIAANVNFGSKRCQYGNFLTFDKDFSKYSPAAILRMHIMQEAHGSESPIEFFDFGSGDLKYKWYYATDKYLFHQYAEPRSVRGLAYLQALRLYKSPLSHAVRQKIKALVIAARRGQ